MGNIKFENIEKSFGEKRILDKVNIEIEDGELFTFLGPSGCGKTTLLRILAGFEKPDSGKVKLGGKDITSFLPEKREIAMVFQNYALFSNMNVSKNVGYGLKTRKMNKQTIADKVENKLAMVGMSEFGERDINELSGGEQQRVCIARALAVEPKVLLLDEPLSNLDAKLRYKMRKEIRELQKELGITTVFVTHDQEEAMSISDRIAVFNDGKIVQVDTPRGLYNHPKNEFIAGFVGESNILNKEELKEIGIEREDILKACIRPQDIALVKEGDMNANIVEAEFNGSHTTYTCVYGKVRLKITEGTSLGKNPRNIGDLVAFKIDKRAVKSLE
ncbi:spermidine/putrescine import ATP-binding protein PotA [Andreesenia angusta]|uniref:Spermidine/putrescine import ATP-binding protein PotA n=1 Tax=Andreesenia angusta TaxID=39480 RepID=A0A1S1V959_9FIRM|nr:ABC transporter ATP-binding protein [Andreesenia angusta]OHW63044.1 spermidine/putrescine import ATP-binding protein PotA [Andreesenia angusta]